MEDKHPELHINEEPRNDFMDTAVGFAVTLGFFTVVTIIATVLTIFL
jgi:hypothetical protein